MLGASGLSKAWLRVNLRREATVRASPLHPQIATAMHTFSRFGLAPGAAVGTRMGTDPFSGPSGVDIVAKFKPFEGKSAP